MTENIETVERVATRESSDDARWEAVLRRDGSARDFVIAVKTTGIFCRCGCPARTPLRKNVAFYATPAEAISAGYRACKRCRPER